MERRLLALDQSSRCSGWAIFINNELKDYGIIELTTDDDAAEGERVGGFGSTTKEEKK